MTQFQSFKEACLTSGKWDWGERAIVVSCDESGLNTKKMRATMDSVGEKRTVVGKRILISSDSDNNSCRDYSSLNKQRFGRGKAESSTSTGISHALSLMMMLSALLTKAVALGVAVPASTSGGAAAATATATVAGSGVALVSSQVKPSTVVADAKMSTSVISAAGDVHSGKKERRRFQVNRVGQTLRRNRRSTHRHDSVGFIPPLSTTCFRHKHPAAGRSSIKVLRQQIGTADRLGRGGFYDGSSPVIAGRRKRPTCTGTMGAENPMYTTLITAAAAVAAGAAGAITAAVAARGQGSMSAFTAASAGSGGSNSSGVLDEAVAKMNNHRNGNAPGPRTLLSLVKWVLTEAWRGGARKPEGSGMKPASLHNAGVHALFLRKWWVGAGMAWLVAKSFGGGGGSGGVGERRLAQSRAKGVRSGAAGIANGGSAFKASLEPSLSIQYPRPQSTAYPRPQSTAYPRPKVTVPTLLDLESSEETIETLRARSRKLAAASRSNGSASADSEDNPLLSKFLCWFFTRMISKRARLVEGLEVSVNAKSNRDAMSGLLQAVGITFNHLELQNLQISAGATMRITGLDLKVMTLLWRRFNSFKKPFEVAGSYVFTSEDLIASPMVRRLVQNMMNATLRRLEAMATDPTMFRKSGITILTVTAKRSRLVIDGEMGYDGVKVPFSYRTSLGVKGKGHVVYLKDPEVFWENVGGSLTLPLLPLTTFDIDIGDTARIESIRIVNGQVAIRARFVLSPFPPLVVASVSKRASFRYDVGERLSVIFGNLVQKMRII